jgi:hypothetical protein
MVSSSPACLGVPLKFYIYHEMWQRVDKDFFQLLAEEVNFGGTFNKFNSLACYRGPRGSTRLS